MQRGGKGEAQLYLFTYIYNLFGYLEVLLSSRDSHRKPVGSCRVPGRCIHYADHTKVCFEVFVQRQNDEGW